MTLVTVDRVAELASEWAGWRYGSTDQEAPRHVQGWQLRQTGTRKIDCITLTTWMLLALLAHIDWTMEDWEALQIYDPDRPWSAIERLVARGAGVEVDVPTVGAWHVCQTWEGRPGYSSGHSRLLLGLADGWCLVWESSVAHGGPGWGVWPWSHFTGRGGGFRMVRLG